MIAFYFHWPYDQLLALEHGERLRWVSELARLVPRGAPGGPVPAGGTWV